LKFFLETEADDSEFFLKVEGSGKINFDVEVDYHYGRQIIFILESKEQELQISQ
jgi:hypothetical protein